MDIPMKVRVTCPTAELKQIRGTLIAISPQGYYEVHVNLGSNTHVVLLPIESTVIMAEEPILAPAAGFEVER